MPLTAAIKVSSTLETAAPVACLPCELGQTVAPVIPYGKPIEGTVTLSGPVGTGFSGLCFRLRTFGARKTAETNAWEAVELAAPVTIVLPLLQEKAYTLDASGSVDMPFKVPADAVPKLDTVGLDKAAVVQHQLDLECMPTGFMAAPFKASQLLAVQVQTGPVDTKKGNLPWMTVGDFGGEAKLQLMNNADLAWPLGGAIECELTLNGTSPLKSAKVVLYTATHGGEPVMTEEVVAWEAADATKGGSPDGTLKVSVPLKGADVCPSVAPIDMSAAVGGTFAVEHSLRLSLESVSGEAGWNTVPVRLGHGAALSGAKAGKLAPPPPLPPPKKRLAAPTPKQRGKWLKRLLVAFLMFAAYAAVDYGVAVMDGETSQLARAAQQVSRQVETYTQKFLETIEPAEAKAARKTAAKKEATDAKKARAQQVRPPLPLPKPSAVPRPCPHPCPRPCPHHCRRPCPHHCRRPRPDPDRCADPASWPIRGRSSRSS